MKCHKRPIVTIKLFEEGLQCEYAISISLQQATQLRGTVSGIEFPFT